MGTKLPVWLSTMDIQRKYEGLCIEKNLTRKFIVKLFRANLLRGHYDSVNKRFMILEESWLDLIKHMNYNMYLQIFPVEGEAPRFSVPTYCHHPKYLHFQMERNWYTPTEVLEEYSMLKHEKEFNIRFLRQLVHAGLVRGSYDPKEKIIQILMPSFIELLLYRDYIIQQNLVSPRRA
jgi:hypothetical protein